MIRYDSVIWSDGVSYSDCVIGTDGMRGSDCERELCPVIVHLCTKQ